jgi:hypothetical protein
MNNTEALRAAGADVLPDTLDIECPHCGNKMQPVPQYHHATNVVRRTCRTRSCRSRWQLTISPKKRTLTIAGVTGQAIFNVLDWRELT